MADSGKRFLCGGYSLILTNLGTTANLLAPIRSSARIKYTSLAVSSKYIVFGASTGGLYVFDKRTFKYLKLIANKDGPLVVLRFSNTSLSIIAAGTSTGKVLVWDIGVSSRDKPKFLKRTDEHKGSDITCLCWDECDSRLFVGDTDGNVSVIHVTSANPLNKGFSLPHLNEIVHKCDSQIVQLDYAVDCLLISTMKGCTIYSCTRSQAQAIGSKPRDGPYGACFFRQEQWNYPAIYCARPGSRLWEVSFDGQVLSTQQYKTLLATAPAVVLGYEHDVHAVQEVNNMSPKAVAFSRLLIIRDRFLVTWHQFALYILDPIIGRVVCWVNLHRDIVDICCLDNQLYIHHADGGQVTWFGLLSVKECVAALFNMNELKQATEVCIQCQDDIIVGSARDMVPKSLIVRLRENFHDKDEAEDIVSLLEVLEQQLEENCPVEEFSVPGLLRLNAVKAASVLSGDLGPITAGSESGLIDDDNLSLSQVEEELTVPSQSRTDISFENMLVSAAVLAKRLKYRGARSPSRRTSSPDTRSPAQGRSTTWEEELQSSFASEETASVPDEVKEPKYVAEKSTGETTEILVYLSDESDTKPSVSEDSTANEDVTHELLVKRERSNTKEKKKKKRKVVTVDIDTPKYKSEEGEALISERCLYDGSASTYASFGETEVQNWSSNQRQPHSKLSPVPPGTTEYAPAIPAMLTKAKGLLVRRKTTGDEELSPAESSTQFPISASDEDTVDETVVIQCPDEVKEFIQLSKKTRDKVKSPSVLYSPDQLFNTLSEWIPHMISALSVCEKLGSSEKETNLKTFLGEDEVEILTLLLHMCFDVGIYEYSSSTSRDSSNVSRDKSNRKTDLGSCIAHQRSLDSDLVAHCQSKDLCNASRDAQRETSSDSAPAQMGIAHKSLQDAVKGTDKNNTCSSIEKGVVQEQPNWASSEAHEELSGSTSHRRIGDSKEGIMNPSHLNLWNCKWCIKDLALETSCSFWQTIKLNTSQQQREQTRKDCERARFIKRFFSFLDLRKLRKTLRLLRGCKHHVYESIQQCLKDVCKEDMVSGHIREGDARRALHVLHDGLADCCDKLIYHLPRCYALDGRETVLTCARLFPNVQPWEVAEMCLDSMSRDESANAENFVFYVDQLMRWREEVGIEREETVSIFCKDETTLLWWIHCALLSDRQSGESPHCSCGLPRAGSHHILWKHSNHLEKVLDYVSQQSQTLVTEIIRLFWQHGYWTGFLTLCTHAGLRRDALQALCFLGDIQLLKAPQKWGLLPKSLEDWRFLVQFLTRERSPKCSCTPCSEISGRLLNLSFQDVVDLALNRLGTRHTIQLLETVPVPEGFLTKAFLYKCILGAMIEKKQRDTIEELLKKLDSYLWSQRRGVLVPSLSRYKDEEQLHTSRNDKDNVASDGRSYAFIRTIEDAATHWGSNIRLADAECHVCGQPLREQVSSSIQGLIVFECGHVFHKHCLPEHACVVCFYRKLTTVAAT